MIKLNFEWKENKGQYQTGESLYLNKIRIGSYGWNSARSQSKKDDSIDWAGQVELPSLSDIARRVYGKTPDDVKAKIEQIVTNWFTEAIRGITK